MKKLTPFQETMMITLLNDIPKGLEFRKYYTHSFDQAFSTVFGKSFGFELEIPKRFLACDYQSIRALERYLLKYKLKCNNRPKMLNSTHWMRVYEDGSFHNEVTFPVFPYNLHLAYKVLVAIQSKLSTNIGTTYDNSSSMHIHIPKPKKSSNNFLKDNVDVILEFLLYTYDLTYVLKNKDINHYLPRVIKGLQINSKSPFNNYTNYSSNYNSIETRCYDGTTDLRIILKRTALLHSIEQIDCNNNYIPFDFLTQHILEYK